MVPLLTLRHRQRQLHQLQRPTVTSTVFLAIQMTAIATCAFSLAVSSGGSGNTRVVSSRSNSLSASPTFDGDVSGSRSSSNSSSTSSKKHSSGSRKGGSSAKFSRLSGGGSPIRYGYYKYASDFDSYVSSSYGLSGDVDVDTDLDIDVHEPIWFPLHYDVDLDLDLDFDDIDLDLDLLKLKYGLYGLNHYSLHNPRFNDYRFRRRYRLRSRPYFRAHHRYLPQYWKHDLEFWGLDNYGSGFGYDKYLYLNSLSTPTSYSHISTF